LTIITDLFADHIFQSTVWLRRSSGEHCVWVFRLYDECVTEWNTRSLSVTGVTLCVLTLCPTERNNKLILHTFHSCVGSAGGEQNQVSHRGETIIVRTRQF
jgi:hypothetical protein